VIDGRRVLAIVPARGGSKVVPRKNLRNICGKPLLALTIEAAQRSSLLDLVVVSSDDREILDIATASGVDTIWRPAELATDESPTIAAVLHALKERSAYNMVVLLQPTSPMRTTEDIDAAIRLAVESGAPACVSVCEASESPYWMFTLAGGRTLSPLLPGVTPTRRQDLPRVFRLNGAIFVADVRWLEQSEGFLSAQTVAYVMPVERSLDIDTEEDFESLARLLAQERGL